MRRSIAFALWALACSKTTRPVPPAPAPPTLVAEASVASLAGATRGVAAYAEAVQPKSSTLIQPGMAALVLADAAGAAGLEGADLEAPVRLLVLDPKKFASPMALLVVVKDEGALKKSVGDEGAIVRVQGTHALVGKPETVKELEGYALGSLAAKDVPADPSATIYVKALIAAYRPELEDVKKTFVSSFGDPSLGMFAGLANAYMDVLFAAAEQTERVEVVARIDGTRGDLELTLHAAAGSPFEAWNAVQRAVDPALLARLPAGPSPFVILGRFALGPLREPAERVLGPLFSGPGVDMKAFFAQFEGSFAAVGELRMLEGGRMTALYQVQDAKASLASIRAMMEKLADAPVTIAGQTMRFGVELHDGSAAGVPTLSYTMRPTLENATPAQQQAMAAVYDKMGTTTIAAVDRWVISTQMPDPAAIGRAISAARDGNGYVPDAAVKRAIDDAVAHRESAVFVWDVATLLGKTSDAPFVFGIGFPDKTLRLRMSLPPLALRGVQGPT